MIKENQEEVHFDEIRDGDLFKLTKFQSSYPDAIGKIAQRYNNSLLFINEDSGSSFSTIFTESRKNEDWKAIIIRRAKK